MLTGTLTAFANGTGFDGLLSTMYFDLGFTMVPNDYKTKDNHPDFQIIFKNSKGRAIRLGSAWTSVSEKTGNSYYSMSITDGRGKEWRMNAVRNEESADGEWQLIPLAGGETLRTMLDGEIEMTDDDALVGSVGSMEFDFNFVAIPVEEKASDDHPDYRIECRSPSGKIIRMGSIWNATSQRSGNPYLSLRFYTPEGDQIVANGVKQSPKDKTWTIIPLTDLKPAAVAA